MYRFCLVASFTLIASCSEPDLVRLQGELVFSSERQTLTTCEDERVYWVRVLAANPYHAMRERADELSLTHGSILAELEGEVDAVSSGGPGYPVDAVLRVRRTHSVQAGSCTTVTRRP